MEYTVYHLYKELYHIGLPSQHFQLRTPVAYYLYHN